MPTCCPKEQGAGSLVVPSCAHVCPAGSGTVVPPSSPTRRETPWVAWLGARAHGGKCPCLPAPRKCLLSHERPAAKLYIKARLMATSKQEGRERQTRRLATVGGEKQLALQAGEGLLQPRGETWQMSQMSQMSQTSQKGWGVPDPNAAAGRLSPTAGVRGVRDAAVAPAAQMCWHIVPSKVVLGNLEETGPRRMETGLGFCCSNGEHHGCALACLHPGALQEANSQGRGAPGSG